MAYYGELGIIWVHLGRMLVCVGALQSVSEACGSGMTMHAWHRNMIAGLLGKGSPQYSARLKLIKRSFEV